MSYVAVVGAGYWGPNLIRNFLSQTELSGVIACDTSQSRLEVVRRQFPSVECCTDFWEILQRPEVEAVAIATPVRLHFPMAKAALQADKHVLVEKPMAGSVDQARELVDLAAAKNRTLMVDHTFIFTGVVDKIGALVGAGELGDFYYIDSVRVNLGLFQNDINVIWDLAPHDLSIVSHLLSRPAVVVRAIGQSHTDRGLVDVAHVHVEYEGGMAAHFHLSWLSPTKIRQMVLAGSKRMIVWNDLEQAEKIRVYDRGVEVTQVNREDQYKMQYGYRMGDVWLPHVDATEALKRMTSHFVDCYRSGKRPITSGTEGLEVVRVLEASEISLANAGRPVSLEGRKMKVA